MPDGSQAISQGGEPSKRQSMSSWKWRVIVLAWALSHTARLPLILIRTAKFPMVSLRFAIFLSRPQYFGHISGLCRPEHWCLDIYRAHFNCKTSSCSHESQQTYEGNLGQPGKFCGVPRLLPQFWKRRCFFCHEFFSSVDVHDRTSRALW